MFVFRQLTANFASLWEFSLRIRLISLTLVIFLVTLWLVSYLSIQTLKTDTEQLLSEQQFATASMVATQIDRALDSRLRSLERAAGRAARHVQ